MKHLYICYFNIHFIKNKGLFKKNTKKLQNGKIKCKMVMILSVRTLYSECNSFVIRRRLIFLYEKHEQSVKKSCIKTFLQNFFASKFAFYVIFGEKEVDFFRL